jgi:POT family proton-dependent oligopeptide transporter
VAGGRRPGELFGHPTCLFTLFFAEMWERFSFYGMKALLILYLVNYLFWVQKEASDLFAWYAGLVYATPILGGIIADKVLGARWSVVIGGVIIAIGHFLLAFEPLPFLYSGLVCLIIGTGMLKPNISTQVGALYRQDDERRDSAFTIFYMGINSGAFLGPLVCGWLQVYYGYHYGFAAAGVGMVLGLIVYIAGMSSVVRRERMIAAEQSEAAVEKGVPCPHEDCDELNAKDAQHCARCGRPLGGAAAATHSPTGVPMSKVYFDRGIVLVVICVFAILFWVGFEQAANVMNLWADQHTILRVFQTTALEAPVADAVTGEMPPAPTGWQNWRMSAAMTQSINPLFIIVFAGVFAWFWQFLEARKRQPSTPLKMAFGVFFLSCAYGILLLGAQAESRPTSAPLANVPPGLSVDDTGRLHRLEVDEAAGSEKRIDYGATRLVWRDNTLQMSGVLTDLDWMRALGSTAGETYRETIEVLDQKAKDEAERVRLAKQAGEMPKDAGWEVMIEVPEAVGALVPIAGWPTKEVDDEEVPKVSWDAEARRLSLTDTLSDRDRAQILAAGADPDFREALTAIYRQSSVHKVSILWLLAFYLVITIGELCLSPVGLSLVTKAAPPQYVGLFMGLWFFTTGFIANFLAHKVGGYWGTMTPGEYFVIFGVLGVVATVIMLLLLRVLKPMLHGIH